MTGVYGSYTATLYAIARIADLGKQYLLMYRAAARRRYAAAHGNRMVPNKRMRWAA